MQLLGIQIWKLRILQPIKSEGLVSPKNLLLIQIQNFAIVLASTANPPGNTKYGQGFVHKAISYANDIILNASWMNLQHAQIWPWPVIPQTVFDHIHGSLISITLTNLIIWLRQLIQQVYVSLWLSHIAFWHSVSAYPVHQGPKYFGTIPKRASISNLK